MQLRGTLDRRSLLRLLAVGAMAWVHPGARAAGARIVIAGGGILGAQLAYRLATRGADVTLLERTAPATGATANSFAWINAGWDKRPVEYFRLNCLGIAAWHELETELPGQLPLRWGGSLEWTEDEPGAKTLREGVRNHQAWGYPARLIDAQTLRALEPRIVPGNVMLGAQSFLEGHVDPVAVTQLLIERARAAGARIVFPAEVHGLLERKGALRALSTSAGEIEADTLVIACGTETPRLARMAGCEIPLKDSPGTLVHTKPLPALLERVVLSPVAHMKQKPDGRIVAGTDFGGTPSTDTSIEAARAFLAKAATVLPELAKAEVERVTLGWRPLPLDNYPAIGFVPKRRDVYVTVMHSGVTLSPAVASLAAMEILDGIDAEPLAPYRPGRFCA